MKRQQNLQHRLQTLTALHDAVNAMRSLSAHHFRRARQALAPARQYRADMDAIVAAVGIHQPLPAQTPTGLLVLASDLGLCGDYNSRLSQLAVAQIQQNDIRGVYCVGRRVRAYLARNGIVPERCYDAPAGVDGSTRLLMTLAQEMLQDYADAKIGGVNVVYARFDGVGRFTPLVLRILPIDPAVPVKPVRASAYIDADYMTSVAVREFLYITLYEVLLDALAAEHGMRMMSAEAALEWLDKSRTQVGRQLAMVRSEAATQELLDIIQGRKHEQT